MEYKEAIEIVKKNYPHVGFSGSQFETALRVLVPELADSEDERIRKKLFHTVLGTPSSNEWFEDISKDKVLSYLEKQKEQKPAEWSEEDEMISEHELEVLKLVAEKDGTCLMGLYDKLKSIRSRLKSSDNWKPSEEQMIELRAVISGCSFDTKTLSSLEKDLKKLM